MTCQRLLSWSAVLLLAITTAVDAQVDGDPFEGPEVEVCGHEVPMDGLSISGVSVDGHTLSVRVGFACGCAPHYFGGCWSGEFSDSAPIQTDLEVAHDANGEGCEAACYIWIEIDLTPISEAYHDVYGPGPGMVLIQLDGWSQSIEYSFLEVVAVQSTTWARVKMSYR
jgi:hypothetical protein